MNAKATDYTTILPVGKENAISTNELAVIMGFSDSRSLQADIAKSRNAGQMSFNDLSDSELEVLKQLIKAIVN